MEDLYGPIIVDVMLGDDLADEANTELTTAAMRDQEDDAERMASEVQLQMAEGEGIRMAQYFEDAWSGGLADPICPFWARHEPVWIRELMDRV